MEKETLEGEDLAAILNTVGTWKPRTARRAKSGPKPGSPAAVPVGNSRRRAAPAPAPKALRRPRPATA
jgi:hypothetical protein